MPSTNVNAITGNFELNLIKWFEDYRYLDYFLFHLTSRYLLDLVTRWINDVEENLHKKKI